MIRRHLRVPFSHVHRPKYLAPLCRPKYRRENDNFGDGDTQIFKAISLLFSMVFHMAPEFSNGGAHLAT
jgi:hypothetical protein